MHTTPLVLIALSCSKPAPPAVVAPPAPDPAAFVAAVNTRMGELYRSNSEAHWAHETDITPEHEAAAAASDEEMMAYQSSIVPQAVAFGEVADPVVARSLHLIRVNQVLPAPSDPEKRKQLAALSTGLSSMYGTGEWCAEGKECLDLGEIEAILAKSTDPAEQLAAWQGWHAVATPMRGDYTKLVALANEGSREIGFANTGDLWRSGYDMPPAELEAEVDRLWTQVKPLYDALHCHVRAELSERYGAEVVPPTGPIPAHLLGNMWAQDWANLYPQLVPYPKEPGLDVTKALVDQKWDDQKMTKTAEAFFVGLGMEPLPPSFWEKSMFVQPADREAVCHASAWDFAVPGDLRLKMCIKPTYDDLVTLHHELGHLYYDAAYDEQPMLFRGGANDGFHEAIGDTIALSMTPEYLHGLGLLDATSSTREAVVNEQMQVALGKIAFLPFGLLVDRWRWEVFDGRITPEQYNEGWWRLRAEIQGVAPPTARDESTFDAGAKYHVAGNTPYLRYFLAHILQFQFHRALCQTAGHQGPLYACSIQGNREAGARFQAMLAMGSSRPWPDALEAATGQRTMDATAVVDYFEPLMAYLAEQNKDRQCGW